MGRFLAVFGSILRDSGDDLGMIWACSGRVLGVFWGVPGLVLAWKNGLI